jgi:hypothetical protein
MSCASIVPFAEMSTSIEPIWIRLDLTASLCIHVSKNPYFRLFLRSSGLGLEDSLDDGGLLDQESSGDSTGRNRMSVGEGTESSENDGIGLGKSD